MRHASRGTQRGGRYGFFVAGADAHAALLAGYLDQSGMLDVQGRGFGLLVADSIAAIDADPAASSVRAEVAAVDATPEWALTTIRDLLDNVLDSNSTAVPPTVDA